MKLEFLAEGSPDCPLIRLYSFTQSEVVRLKQIIDELANGNMQSTALHQERGIDAVRGCEFVLTRGDRDNGTNQTSPLHFECVLSKAGWADVSFLLQPFCETGANGFQWLEEKGPISLLISVKGTW